MKGTMRLNDAVRMVQSVWGHLPAFYPNVYVDAYIVMSNHIHGIIVLVGTTPCGRPRFLRGRHGSLYLRAVRSWMLG